MIINTITKAKPAATPTKKGGSEGEESENNESDDEEEKDEDMENENSEEIPDKTTVQA